MKESGYTHSSNYFGLPLFVLVPKQNLTYGILYQHIASSLRRFLKDATTSTSDEINSNMNKSLSKQGRVDLTILLGNQAPVNLMPSIVKKEVKDEDSQHSNDMVITEDDEESSTSVPTTRSSARLKNKSNKLFNIFIPKNDYYDYDNQQQTNWTDDTPIELSAKEIANQPIVVVAELNKQGYNSAPLDVSRPTGGPVEVENFHILPNSLSNL